MNKTAECTLSDEQLIKQVEFWVSALCKSNGDAWTLRVPPDPNYDPDMVITELMLRFERHASLQCAEMKKAYELEQEENIRLVAIGESFVDEVNELKKRIEELEAIIKRKEG